MPTIYVNRNGNSYQLRLSDSEGHNPGNDDLTTDVSPGDTVIWQLGTNSGLASIESINLVDSTDPSYVQGSQNLLTATPTSSNGVFSGTVISSSPGSNAFECYKIGFKVPGDTTTYYDDPKLQMK